MKVKYQNLELLQTLDSIVIMKPILKNPLKDVSYTKEEVDKKRTYVEQVLDGIRTNPHITSSEKEVLYQIESILYENEWLDLESVYDKVRHVRIEVDHEYEIPKYTESDRTLHLKENFPLKEQLYLILVPGIKGHDDLNQIYSSYMLNQDNQNDPFYDYFKLLVDIVSKDHLDGAMATGNVYLLLKDIMVQNNLKKAMSLLQELTGYYHYRNLEEERIEKIVCKERYLTLIKEVYKEKNAKSVLLDSLLKKAFQNI